MSRRAKDMPSELRPIPRVEPGCVVQLTNNGGLRVGRYLRDIASPRKGKARSRGLVKISTHEGNDGRVVTANKRHMRPL